MSSDRLWAVSFAFAVACGSSDGGPSTGVAGGGANAHGGSAAGGLAGAQASAGLAGAPASAGTGGGLSNGGIGGSTGAHAGSSGVMPMSGGTSGAPSSGGRSNSAGGSTGRAGATSSSGGAPANAGGGSGGKPATGGTGGCVQNLACKLTAPPTSGDLHQDCVDRINQFRTQCACLPALARSTDGEACADQMAEYDAAKNTAHAGYSDKICQPSGAQNSCPGYSSNNQVISLCMQQMWDEGPPPTNPCNDECFHTYGHFINMTSTSSKKVACGFYTTSAGKVWAVQNFLR